MSKLRIAFFVLAGLLTFCCHANGETLKFSFHCQRHISLDETQTVNRPFANCWIHVFQLNENEGVGERC